MPRLGVADELRPDQRTAVAGHEAHRHVRIADLGILLRDDDVAQQGQRRAEPGGVAVEPADERLVEIELAEHDLLRLASGLLEQGRVVDCRLHPIDIAAGTERAAAAGEHHDIRLRIVPDFDEDAGELGVERGIDRIERVRPVEREHEDAPAAFDGDGPIRLIAFHGALRVWSTARRRSLRLQLASARFMLKEGKASIGSRRNRPGP